MKERRLKNIIRLAPLFLMPVSFFPSLKAQELPDTIPGLTAPSALPADSVSLPEVDAVLGIERRRGSITPVDNDRERPQQPTLHYYDRHGNPLPVPVLYLTEPTDTVVSPRSPYPLYNGVTVGIDFFEGFLKLCGQSYASMGISAQISLHNWFFPVLEAGVGWGNHHPDGKNYDYKAKPTPFIKLGINYNFLYKSNPDYMAYLGLRAGYSHTRYDITDISISNSEWGQTIRTDILDQKANAFFGEVTAGIKVKIVGRFSLGWRGRYRFMFKQSYGTQSSPWFFPGYGASSPFSADFSAYWTF